jgi:hypothetical protein
LTNSREREQLLRTAQGQTKNIIKNNKVSHHTASKKPDFVFLTLKKYLFQNKTKNRLFWNCIYTTSSRCDKKSSGPI